jgi:hypothetical protein
MNLKKKKFYNLTEFFTLFNAFNKNICLFAHINNSNIGLLKKLTKNPLLFHVLTGPTQLFFFDNVQIFYDFLQIDFIKKKIYPLTIYFNNSFFNFMFFYNYIKEKINNVLKKDSRVYDILLYNITNIHKNYIIQLNYIIHKFITNLGIILNKFL